MLIYGTIVLLLLPNVCCVSFGGNNVCSLPVRTRVCTSSWLFWTRCSTRYTSVPICCDGWTTANPDAPGCDVSTVTELPLTSPTTTPMRCPNGGTPTSGNYCVCPDNYYSPNCDECTRIQNCEDLQHFCTTRNDQQCRRCEYTVNEPEIKAYQLQESSGYPNRRCTQLCSWRSDSKQCYPGSCTGSPKTPSTCRCATGFSSSASDCMSITQRPDITNCLITTSTMQQGSVVDYIDADCTNTNNPTIYTNNRDINHIRVDWATRYVGPDITDWPLPYYVEDFKVGIILARVLWYHNREGSSIRSGTFGCSTGYSQSNPNLRHNDCDEGETVSASWQNGDVLEIRIQSRNGGYMKVRNYDRGLPGVLQTQYYNSSTHTNYASITFDYEPPTHCSLSSTCSSNMLQVGAPYTRDEIVYIAWYGWSDPLSGIVEYDIEVYKFSPLGDTLGYASEPLLLQTHERSSNRVVTFAFPDPGVYCFLLTVTDAVGNFQHARRFVLFDNVSTVNVSLDQRNSMTATSASANTSYTWQTNINQEVVLNWSGHFFNELHHEEKFLAPINDHHVSILPDYEEETGQPPLRRSEQGIPHVNGIVRYQLAYSVDHEGGRTILDLNELNLIEVQNFQMESHQMEVIRQDGDSIRFWVRAWDVLNNTVDDSVLIHIDSTAPEAELRGLFKNGVEQLAVHSLVELYDLSFRFVAFDYHSGLREVRWELHDMNDPGTIHGSSQLPVSNVSCTSCVIPYCYQVTKDEKCFDKEFILQPDASLFVQQTGRHDFDYVFKIVITNNALLVTTSLFQITIDTSPPEPGTVKDSESGQRDRDFQTSSVVHASWTGFFDQESGVMLYKYIFSASCMSDEDFTHDNEEVHETRETFAEFVNASPGTYYTTVVAYNRAMEPSVPVCSDGVTIDVTPPYLGNIYVEDLSVKEGLVTDGSETGYLDNNVHLHNILNQSAECRNRARLVDDLSKFGSYVSHSLSYTLPICSDAGTVGEYMFFSQEYTLNMSWTGFDNESSPLAYEVCVGSTSTSDDIIPCTSTHGHQQYTTYHTNLRNNQVFYIQVKATNKAGLAETKVLGPIVVKISGPEEAENLHTEVTTEDMHEYVHVSWTFDDSDQSEILTSFLHSIYFAMGEVECLTNHMKFTMLEESLYTTRHCAWHLPPRCLSVEVRSLGQHMHYGTTYCVIIKLLGTNGFVTYMHSSFPYHHGYPMVGSVIEIELGTEILVATDIDYQTTQEFLSIEYNGIDEDRDSEVFLEAGIGRSNSQADVVAYLPLELDHNIFTFEALSLLFYRKYYVLVKAIDQISGLESVTSSDGVTVLPPERTLIDIVVRDGERCFFTSDDHDDHDDASRFQCGDDIDFQAETTSFAVHWITPSQYLPFITSQHVVLHKENSDGSVVQIHPSVDFSVGDSAYITGLVLEPGALYKVALSVCHMAACYETVSSDGVWVLPEAPISSPISQAILNNAGSQLSLSWFQFGDMYIDGHEFIDRYEMSIYVQHPEGEKEYIRDWITIDASRISVNGELLSTVFEMQPGLRASSCIMVAVRGYAKTGLHSTISSEIAGCQPNNPEKFVVLDAVGDIDNEGNVHDIIFDVTTSLWTKPEREFTPSRISLSAVWPDLRHGQFDWKVVTSDDVSHWAYYRHRPDALAYNDFHCTASEVLACGHANENYINIYNLTLEEGRRYYVCVNAPAITLEHELWSEHLDRVSACSNGIVVDTQPPLAGRVWMGQQLQHKMFTTESREITVQWAGFIDAEAYADTMHDTAINYYTLSFGTEPGGNDVVERIDVGITNHYHFRGLSLEEGRPYYATVTAHDFVSHTTQVSSPAIYIDTSAPVLLQNTVQISHAFLTLEQDIEIIWRDSFNDGESGLSQFHWCLGTYPNLCDMSNNTQSLTPSLTLSSADYNLVDGRYYYITIQVTNGAGLVTTTSSPAFEVDRTEPVAGVVIEISQAASQDIDYQVATDTLKLMWDKFYDPHVHMYSYQISIGSCIGCTDVLDKVDVGLKTEFTIDHLELANGVRYYTTVTACSIAELCTSSTSDGVMIDVTPPHIAWVLDGNKALDIDFQSSRTIMTAQLTGYHDIESGLIGMTVWLSTLSTGDQYINITQPHMMHVHNTVTLILEEELPENQNIFTNIRLCNNVGLCTLKKSNGLRVDSSPPVERGRVSINRHGGSIIQNTQVWQNAVVVTWNIVDDNSPISHSIVSLSTDEESVQPISKVNLFGYHRRHIFTNLELKDGDIIVVSITSCNKALLCTTSISEPNLIDNTMPTTGAFAISTSHSVDETLQFSRSAEEYMTYSHVIEEVFDEVFNYDTNQTELIVVQEYTPAKINLSWIGFQDPHSEIDKYYITIGHSYHGNELLGDNRYVIRHNSLEERSEGFLQTATIDINNDIADQEQLYITIQAQNFVGLQSTVLHGLFETIPSDRIGGILHLVRRCEMETCESHCTCAPHGRIHCSLARGSCTDITGDTSYASIEVLDVKPSSINLTEPSVIVYSISTDTLSARWNVGSSGRQPKWFEWSVGIGDGIVGVGLLDLQSQPVWFDNMKNQNAVFTRTLSHIEDLLLEPNTRYVFHVKAWYSDTEFAVATSNGTEIDTTPPELSSSFKLKEVLTADSDTEIDVTTDPSRIYLKWTNVFRDGESGLQAFKVCIGTSKGSCDVAEQLITDTSVTGEVVSGILMSENKRYHSSVIACNAADLCSVAYSDGFKVDTSAPTTGFVYAGTGLHDDRFTTEASLAAASWDGFYDDGSFIRYFNYCVSTDASSGIYIACRNTRDQLATISLPSALNHDVCVYSAISAVNGVGLESDKIFSNCATVDLTPPETTLMLETGINLVTNPSFEANLQDEWMTRNDQYTIDDQIPYDGLKYICLRDNEIYQTLNTVSGLKYRFSFAAKRKDLEVPQPSATCYIKAGSAYEMYVLSDKTNTNYSFHEEWIYHHLYFHSTNTTTVISLGTKENKLPVCFDNVDVQEISYTEGIQEEEGSIHVKLRTSPESTELVATWNIEDFESSILNTEVGLGTVQGGVQISKFKSVGNHKTYRKGGLKLQHGTVVHITLKVTNGAGLFSVFYGPPVVVDITPPEIISFELNTTNNILTSFGVNIAWESVDAESGVETCWISGVTEDGIEVLGVREVAAEGSQNFRINFNLQHGQNVHFLLRCKSNIGLVTSSRSNVITMVTQGPDVSNAEFTVIHEPTTMYPERGHHISSVDHVWLKWAGVRDDVTIDHCQVNLANLSDSAVSWSEVGSKQRRFLNVQNLNLENGRTYTLELRCTNVGGFSSDLLTTQFMVDTVAPNLSGDDIEHTWINENTLLIDWTACFISRSELVFQVHAGAVRGGAGVLKWAETSSTTMQILRLDNTLQYDVTVVAINMAGLHTSQTVLIG